MKIEINLNSIQYHIEVEPSCFTPYRHGTTEKGATKETALGYCSTLSRAVHLIIKEELSSSPETVTLLEYVERYENCLEECRSQLDF